MMPNQWYLEGYREGRKHQFTSLLIGLLSGCVWAVAILWVWGWLA